jgi:putative flippase GtrA
VPVDWVDDLDSRVHVVSTAKGDLLGMWRMMRGFARDDGSLPAGSFDSIEPQPRPFLEQLVRFGSIGLVSTIVFALGFLLLAGSLGHVLAAITSFALCSVVNTAANRRLTFSLRGRTHRLRHFARGLVVSSLPLAMMLMTLAALAALGFTATLPALAALTVVNVVTGLLRFVLLQRWVFRGAW